MNGNAYETIENMAARMRQRLPTLKRFSDEELVRALVLERPEYQRVLRTDELERIAAAGVPPSASTVGRAAEEIGQGAVAGLTGPFRAARRAVEMTGDLGQPAPGGVLERTARGIGRGLALPFKAVGETLADDLARSPRRRYPFKEVQQILREYFARPKAAF